MLGRMRRLAFAFMLLLCPLPAAADAVGPPPSSCPEGSAAVDFCHGPATCSSLDCETDGDFGAGEICADRPLCVREHCCSGRCCAGGCGGEPTIYTHVTGPCGSGGTCDAFDTTCAMRKVCVTPTAMDAGPPDEDAGPTDEDAGSTDEDSGPSSMDAGEADSGSDPLDSGAGTDSGVTPPATDGGCCSVAGSRGPVGGVLFLALFLVTLGRLRRR